MSRAGSRARTHVDSSIWNKGSGIALMKRYLIFPRGTATGNLLLHSNLEIELLLNAFIVCFPHMVVVPCQSTTCWTLF